MKIILASQSPRRRQLLEEAGVEFTVMSADVDEISCAPFAPETAMRNAELKAQWAEEHHSDALVIASDTVVEFKHEILGKPADLDEARVTLSKLSGNDHLVVTGVSMKCLDKNIDINFADITHVVFKEFNSDVVEEYIQKVHVLDKAGAYGIQECGDMLVDHYEGEFDTVMGLPTKRILEALEMLKATRA